MFGRSVDKDGYQRETTPFQPTSPYGCAKVFAFNMVKHYRIAYKLFACNGILFNHRGLQDEGLILLLIRSLKPQ